jgi:cell division topological specificity factor
MMNWLSHLLGRSGSSAEIAKNRLKLVLTYDRTNLTPEMMNVLQDEIVTAISRHLEIDRTGMTFTTQRGDNGDHLVADIPIIGSRFPRSGNRPVVPAPPKRKSTRRASKATAETGTPTPDLK